MKMVIYAGYFNYCYIDFRLWFSYNLFRVS